MSVRASDLAAQAKKIADDVNHAQPRGEVGSLSLAVLMLSEAVQQLLAEVEA